MIKILKADKELLKEQLDRSQRQIFDLVQNASEAWRLKLHRIFTGMGLDNTFRISIYRHTGKTGTFIMLGRYAAILALNSVGRGIYPEQGGCIGRAWASPEGEAHAVNLPASEDLLATANFRDWGLSEEHARGLKMKSRSIYALSLMDALNVNRTAIIVFESTKPNAIDINTIRTSIEKNYRAEILSDLESLKFIEPSPLVAQAAGF